MVAPGLHHVLVATRDLEKCVAFYRDVLELRPIERPNFSFGGAWFQFGGGQHLHIVIQDNATLRGDKMLDTTDIHFALWMDSFTKTAEWLRSKGFSEDLPENDMRRRVWRPKSSVGRPRIYIMDPDHNIIEFICDAFE